MEVLRKLTQYSTEHPLIVKARQKRGVNTGHVHKDLFPYQSLAKLQTFNAEFVEFSMEKALRQYDRFLSCSSTGVFEAAAMGKWVGLVSRFEGWTGDWAHIASLAYSTRYGLTVDLDERSELRRADEKLHFEFGLEEDSPLLALRERLVEYAQSKRWQSTPPAGKRDDREVPRSMISRAYAACGNPHMALFQELRGVAEISTTAVDEDYVNSLLGKIWDSTDIRATYVEPLLRSAPKVVVTGAFMKWFTESQNPVVSRGREWLGVD
jgi:hypothetical protein